MCDRLPGDALHIVEGAEDGNDETSQKEATGEQVTRRRRDDREGWPDAVGVSGWVLHQTVLQLQTGCSSACPPCCRSSTQAPQTSMCCCRAGTGTGDRGQWTAAAALAGRSRQSGTISSTSATAPCQLSSSFSTVVSRPW